MSMYHVGQVVYVIFTKKQRVIPVKVVEEIVRKSVNGESTQYLVNVPGRDEPVDLERLGTEVYASVEEVQVKLRQNAESAINDMPMQATQLAQTHFLDEEPTSALEQYHTPTEEGTGMKIMLDDGTVANVHMGDNVTTGENVFVNKKKVTN